MVSTALQLPNGLRVVVCRTVGPPLVTIGVAYHVGSADELPTKTGYAHLFEHLMFDNIADHDGKSFDELVTEAGGISNAYTTFDWTYYHMTLPTAAWRLGLELEAERMRDFVISPQALEIQRNVVLEEIAENVFNQPYGTAQMLLAQAAFAPDSCYGWDVYGSPDHLRAMTLEDAREWYWQYYRPNNAVLAVVGAFDSATEIVEAVEELFSSIAPAAQMPPRTTTAEPRHHQLIERNEQLPRDMLICAYHFPGMHQTQAMYTAEVLATVLSSGRSSPLARHFIYDEQHAQHASTTADHRERGSLFQLVVLARDRETTSQQLFELWQQLITEFIQQPIDAEHMERARNKLRRRYAQSFQTTEGIANMVATATLLFNDPEHPWHELETMTRIEEEELRHFAEQLVAQTPAMVHYVTR